MKMPRFLCLSLLVAGLSNADAQSFHVESPDLRSLPAPIEHVLRLTGNAALEGCRLVGRAVELGVDGRQPGFVVTTADACNWGAASGPIWVVRAAPLTVVLAFGGDSLTLGKDMQNGLRHIALGQATAGTWNESLWKFNGVRYVKVKERSGVGGR